MGLGEVTCYPLLSNERARQLNFRQRKMHGSANSRVNHAGLYFVPSGVTFRQAGLSFLDGVTCHFCNPREGNMVAVVVSLINMKGGVGKTNVGFNLVWYAAHRDDKKVLLIDLDPQA
ncbi:MAG: AAA family ATPase, partial [Xanthobacteraceae bacterium]